MLNNILTEIRRKKWIRTNSFFIKYSFAFNKEQIFFLEDNNIYKKNGYSDTVCIVFGEET